MERRLPADRRGHAPKRRRLGGNIAEGNPKGAQACALALPNEAAAWAQGQRAQGEPHGEDGRAAGGFQGVAARQSGERAQRGAHRRRAGERLLAAT